MESKDDQAKNQQQATGIGPGERLQAARIKQGLSLADVAARMHLNSSIVEAIEDNNFEEITAPIFVKGYLRAYARIVSLDEDDLINQYTGFYPEDDPPISSTSNVASELSVADARVKWMTYVVVLVVGVAIAAWLWNREQTSEAPISLDTQSSSLEELASGETEVISSEIEAVSEESLETDASESADVVEAAAETEVQAEPVENTALDEPASAADAIEVVEVEAVEVEAAETGVVATEVAAGEAAESEDITGEAAADEDTAGEAINAESGALQTAQVERNEPSRIAPAGSDKLNLVVHADTWADIKDANAHQLVYDLLRAEESVDLMGEAPFTVFLGNGHGVEIMFNGEQVEVAPRIRDDNTARLKIGR